MKKDILKDINRIKGNINYKLKNMKPFEIEIKETLTRIVTVKASNVYDALEKVNSQYKNEKIVLDSDDHINTEIEPYNSNVQ